MDTLAGGNRFAQPKLATTLPEKKTNWPET